MKNQTLSILLTAVIGCAAMTGSLYLATEWSKKHPVTCDQGCRDAQNRQLRAMMFPPNVP